ncbi:Asparagine--tRNA ligase [Buchnera aphidicola (Thelaxes suberi)]|uniref:asparagine--tRNA ligase n=1 Tax=Buchnera aphidicola TaxID=9 RepID=UPI003463A153
MQITLISDINHNLIPVNNKIRIQGWIKNRRKSKLGITFLDLMDGSSIRSLQIVASDSLNNYPNEILLITTGCSIDVYGTLIFSKRKEQKYEIVAQKIQILGWVDNPHTYPISSKKHTLEYLREVNHLRPRTNLILAVSVVRNILFQSIHSFLFKEKFYWIPTPIITSIDAEGTGEMFSVNVKTEKLNNRNGSKEQFIYEKFFNKESFLTVSGQLTLESYASALSRVYTFGPIFRAENSNTSRHLSEFWMLEIEAAFFDLNKILLFSEKLIKYVFESVINIANLELQWLSDNLNINLLKRIKSAINNKFIVLEYSEAIKILNKNFVHVKENKISFGDDLNSEQERYLVEKHFRNNNIIAIINYPKKIKAFYMRINKDAKTVAAMDIIFPYIGEIIGGSQREERLDYLDKRMIELKLNKKEYWWYRDLRKYGTVPHSGLGIGFERLLMYITGMNNIRDVIPFPRTVNNANF